MINIARNDHAILAQWWWSIDRITLLLLIILMIFGLTMIIITGPIMAERIHESPELFIHKTFLFLPVALCTMLFVSFLSPRQIKRICLILFPIIIMLLIMTKFHSTAIKGANRWINIFGVTVQPSEFAKPIFLILSATCITAQAEGIPIPGYFLSGIMYLTLMILFLIQPDFGQTFLISCLWIMQLFLIGLPLIALFFLGLFGGLGILSAYFFSPHVQARIDAFLTSKNFQAQTALHAFQAGGFLGKASLPIIIPDSHSDFVFAAIGEMFGTLICIIVVSLFIFVLLRTLYRLLQSKELFILNAGGSLLTLFCLQGLINMASSLSLIPTKGLTLPFIAYGGSSSVSTGLAMGFLLALTRKPLCQ